MVDRLSSSRFHWLSTLIALLAVVGQLAVAVAPLAEGRERRMGSHVESSGSRSHFVHDEAKCAACQARLIQGAPSRVAQLVIPMAITSGVERDLASSTRAAAFNLQSNPRA